MGTEEKMTRRILHTATGLLLLLLSGATMASDLLDRIIAVVGQDVIMLSELRNEAAQPLGHTKK